MATSATLAAELCHVGLRDLRGLPPRPFMGDRRRETVLRPSSARPAEPGVGHASHLPDAQLSCDMAADPMAAGPHYEGHVSGYLASWLVPGEGVALATRGLLPMPRTSGSCLGIGRGHPRRHRTARPGEIVAILGRNGADKATLLRALSGLLGDAVEQADHRKQPPCLPGQVSAGVGGASLSDDSRPVSASSCLAVWLHPAD